MNALKCRVLGHRLPSGYRVSHDREWTYADPHYIVSCRRCWRPLLTSKAVA